MKKYKQISILLFLIASTTLNAQVGIGTSTPSPSSVLDIVATDKGILVPRMSTGERDNIQNPEPGLLIFNTDDLEFNFYRQTSGWKDMSTNFKSVTEATPTTSASITDTALNSMSIVATEGTYLVSFNSQFNNEPTTTSITTEVPGSSSTVNTTQCFAALTSAIASLDAVGGTILTHPAIIGNGETILPGKYFVNSAISIAGNLTLDAQGNSDALFIFQAEGAINSSVFSTVILAGGAKACNVFWLALGGVGIGADCVIKGNLIARTAAIAVGFRSTLEGRMLSGGGAIAFGPGTAVVPVGTSSINLGVVAPFIIYTHAGGLGNVIDGANTTSIYNGLITSDAGAATGFETATLSNPIIPAGGTATYGPVTYETTTTVADNNATALATFSIYANGFLLPNSVRELTSNASNSTVNLQIVAQVTSNLPIEIKWHTNLPANILSVKNRTLSLTKIK
jgi:hypothetical protein